MPMPMLKILTSPRLVENKRMLFFLIFLALSAIVLTSWQSIAYLTGKNERFQLLRQATVTELERLETRVAEKLAVEAIALRIVARSPSLSHYAHQTETESNKVLVMFESLIASSPNVFQIRYLDKEGNEKVRIERRRGSLQVVAIEALQNKKNRQYFQEASSLSPGQMYVSPLELNMEHGEVEVPWRPTIRLAMPVYPSITSFEGVIVININAESILKIYQTSKENVTLLNPDGHLLLGNTDQPHWGFMFSQRPPFPQLHPNIWQKTLKQPKLDILVNGSHWAVHSTSIKSVMPETISYTQPKRTLWIAVVNKGENTPHKEPFALIPIAVTIILLGVLSWIWTYNINHKKRTELELQKSEKMAALGGLVAGVAHELNTPLGSAVTIASTIKDRATQMRRDIDAGALKKSNIINFVDDMQGASDVLLSGLHRAAELIGQFKLIAVDQTGEKRREFALDTYLTDLSATLAHLFKHSYIHLKLDFRSEAKMHSYPGSLSQVVINLINNALTHGFNENESGEVTLYSKEINSTQVAIGVIDNGVGIDEKIIHRIFEPFFTTKLGQGGSGLGLHITFNIVHNLLGGRIAVTSDTKNRRTEFTVTLPKSFFQKDVSQTTLGVSP